MIRASNVRRAGTWTEPPADTIVLDSEARRRRRVALTGVRGTDFLLDLPEAPALRHGDALALDDGRLIEIVAAPEPLAEIRATDPLHALRLAWHFGNRHLPTEIGPAGRLRIRRDPVIEAMAAGLGAKVREIEAPFEPEGGAYPAAAEAAVAAHDHGHHGHDHDGHDHRSHHDHDHKSPPHR